MDALNRIKFLEDRLHRLSEIGMALSTEKNTDRLFEMILDEAKNITNADGRTLYSMNNEGNLNFDKYSFISPIAPSFAICAAAYNFFVSNET